MSDDKDVAQDVAPLTVETLIQELKDLVDWESFALNLPRISYTDIQIIRRDHGSQTQVQKMELFDHWIKAYPQGTWEDVTDALIKNNEHGLAQSINLYQQHQIIKMASENIKQPTVDALCHLLRGLSHWVEFAMNLPGITPEMIDEAKQLAAMKLGDNCITMRNLFIKWLEKFPSASWNEVLKGIDKTKAQVHEKIQTEHLIKDVCSKAILPYVIYKPTVHTFVQNLKGLKNMKEFGLYLPGIQPSHITSISNSKHDNSVDVKEQLFIAWLNVHPTPKWIEVLLALDKSSNTSLAIALREKLPFHTLHFDETPFEIEIGKETVKELRSLSESYQTITFDFETELSRQLSSDHHLSNMMRWVKRMPAYNLEKRFRSTTVASFTDFFDVIAIHHNFLNCYLPLSLANQFLQQNEIIARLTNHSDNVQKFMESTKIQSLRTSLVPFVNKDPLQEPISIKLHHCYDKEDMSLVQTLLKKVFGVEQSKLLQIFRITPGSLLVTLLAPRFALKKLISNTVMKRLPFMMLVGILSLQIKTSYVMQLQEEANEYTYESGLIAALEASEYEAVKFLVSETQVDVNTRAASDSFYDYAKQWQNQMSHSVPYARADCIDEKLGLVVDDNANVIHFQHHDLLHSDLNSNLVFPCEPNTTPLMIACYNNDTELVQLLLEKGADPNMETETGWTALMYAAIVGSGQAIRLLLKYKANIDKNKKSNGSTALHYGCQRKNEKAVDILLYNSADPNVRKKDGATPLYVASEEGHLEMVRKLLRMERINTDIQKQYYNEATPLSAASGNGHYEVVDELLKANARPNHASIDGVTPLYLASQNGHFKVVKRLLQERVDPNVRLNKDGTTPLLAASEKGHLNVVEALLQAGADPNTAKDNGTTPLSIASEFGHVHIVERLLEEHEILVDAPLQDGRTALFQACQNGYTEVAWKLLEAQADPNAETKDAISKLTPLTIAEANGYMQIVDMLCLYGAVNN